MILIQKITENNWNFWTVNLIMRAKKLLTSRQIFGTPYRLVPSQKSTDFTETRDSEWQWHQLGHMQVCTSLQTDNHANAPPLCFLQARCPSCRQTNSVKALKVHWPKIRTFSEPTANFRTSMGLNFSRFSGLCRTCEHRAEIRQKCCWMHQAALAIKAVETHSALCVCWPHHQHSDVSTYTRSTPKINKKRVLFPITTAALLLLLPVLFHTPV